MTEDTSIENGSSRRTFMKNSAIASGALALGIGSTGTAGAQEDQNILVFAYEYFPGATFRVTAPLQTSTTVEILNGTGDEGIPEISQPDEYNGYIINYVLGDTPIYTYAFTRQTSLQRDTQYQFSQDAQVFSTQLNLLQTSVSSSGDS